MMKIGLIEVPDPTDADFALEAEIVTAVQLIDGATCNAEYQSGLLALERLVKSRSDFQMLRIEHAYQTRKRRR